ncbi:MAG: hypothetical protein P1P59_04405 [Treponemataceae bacterium]
MYCKRVDEADWEKRQVYYEAEADYELDKARVQNGEYRFLFRFIKRAVRFFLVKNFS